MKLSDVNATMDAGLEEIARGKLKVNQCLAAYRGECQRLIDEVGAGSRADAEKRFEALLVITGRLSKAWFVDDIDIGSELKKIVRAFERLHEPHTREHWYKAFQAGVRWPI